MNIERLYNIFESSAGITTDTRKILPNTIFFALKGENFNGNDFALTALEMGATYCVIDEEPQRPNSNLILVEDVLETLQLLASYHRSQFNIPVVAITGSNGKTTTKELLNVVLSKKFNVACTKGNFNNHIGVPLTLLDISNRHQIALIEMGDNHRNEVELLCEIAAPTHGFVTNVGKDHLEGFGSFENNILAKKEVFDYLSDNNGVAFIDESDELVANMAKKVNQKVTFGLETSQHFIRFAGSDPVVKFSSAGGKIVQTQMFGEFNFKNMALAACIGNYFEVPSSDIELALSEYSPSNNRSQVLDTKHNTLILDAYNANPSSVAEALKSLANMETKMAKWAVLGDMFELGSYSDAEHCEMADLANSLPLDQVILIGKNYAKNATIEDAAIFETKLEAETGIKKIAPEGAIILFKGSRGMRLETLIDLF